MLRIENIRLRRDLLAQSDCTVLTQTGCAAGCGKSQQSIVKSATVIFARLRREFVIERRRVEQHIKRAGDGLSLREVEHVVRIRIGGDTRNARGLDVAIERLSGSVSEIC